jgi:membrane associated rhomboid family serine protease
MIPLRDSLRPRCRPVVTWVLIGLNVWMFLYELTLGAHLGGFIETSGFVPLRSSSWPRPTPRTGPRGARRC